MDYLAENGTFVNSTEREIEELVEYYNDIGRGVRLYVTPIIIFGGTIGNILTIIVVLSRHFRHGPLSIPFISLATVDIGVLYCNLMDIWLGALTGNKLQYVRDMSVFGCKFSSFVTIYLSHCSSWILVLINLERVVSVWRPLQARSCCSGRKMGMGLAILLTVLALISLHLFWTTTYDPDREHACEYDDSLLGGPQGLMVWLTLDATLFSFLPFILILGSNILICASLAKARRKHQKRDSAKSITTMLVTISIVFLIATTPLTVCYQFHDELLDHFADKPVQSAFWYDLFINTILVLLCYSSNAVNFLLYCVSGSKFRQALKEVCKCQKSTYTRQKAYERQQRMYNSNTNGYRSTSPLNTLNSSPSTRHYNLSNVSLQHAIRLEQWQHEDSQEREML